MSFSLQSQRSLPTSARLGALIGIGIAALIFYYVNPPNDFPKGGTATISAGASLKSVSTSFKDQGFVRSSTLLSTLVTFLGGEHRISPGDYYFSNPKTVFSVAYDIAHGKHNLDPVKVTIPEGQNVREIGATLLQKLPSFDSQSFIKLAAPHEGYLFPETYFLYPRTTPETALAEMQAMFVTQTTPLFTKQALAGRTKENIVIMASIIEREAHGDDDRATIAGILYNRIERGIPLGVDATVAYAKGIPENQMVASDTSFESPFNTYLHGGLPPSPIANPGLEALGAALSPAKTDYLYYIHDKKGVIHYAKTYKEHQANINRYLK